ncbi:MAG: GNAT family N-acetyltransferase [Asgard group archaeon]|nr:GNAT family N-acetyltransferase [Asgard group archaeon]
MDTLLITEIIFDFMPIIMRSFDRQKDFESIQEFLTETYKLTKSFQNWAPTRFENRMVGPCGKEYKDEDDDLVKIWEYYNDSKPKTQEIVAVTILNSSGANWIQIHPDYKYLEKELVLWIEEQLKISEKKSPIKSRFFVLSTDTNRLALLTNLGYETLGVEEYVRTRPIDKSIPKYNLPKDYIIRGVNVKNDFVKYREVLEAVFPHCKKMTEKLFKIYTSATFYNENLDIIAVAPNGEFVAFATFRLDPTSKIVELEPVGTHPNHRKLGLATAVINEGLKRLKKYKPEAIVILGAANIPGANQLYNKLGFTEKTEIFTMEKEL